ncbi:MAG: NfeD family protein [Planctomycetota bacterium]|nr:MAG: NfeD family protein [Planctomycetota bacterium]
MEPLGITPTHLWIVAAIVLAIAEIFIPGFAVMCFAVGALVSGILSYLNFDIITQWAAFCVASLVFAITLRPLLLKFVYKKTEDSKTNVDALIGKRAKVVKEIPGNMEKGRVLVDGQEWSAISQIDLPIPEGQTVIIEKVDGNKLIVEMEKK